MCDLHLHPRRCGPGCWKQGEARCILLCSPCSKSPWHSSTLPHPFCTNPLNQWHHPLGWSQQRQIPILIWERQHRHSGPFRPLGREQTFVEATCLHRWLDYLHLRYRGVKEIHCRYAQSMVFSIHYAVVCKLGNILWLSFQGTGNVSDKLLPLSWK